MGWLECDFWAPFSWGHPKASGFCFQSERLLYGREPNAIKGGTGKQRPRSCRTQELARSSGPRKCVAEKGWLTRLDKSQYDGRTTSTCETKKTVANVRARILPVGRTAQKGGRDSIVSLGLDNPGRGEDPGQRSARFEGRGRSPMEVADDGLEHRLRRLLPGGRLTGS